jgi:parallel beta-helix repeat protein
MKITPARPHIGLTLAFILVITCQTSTCLCQGSLTPPGAPAPIFKTLQQIEPRTPISSLPFTINASGSYYVTGNLTGVAGQDGITVNADDVTMDLGGFELIGPGSGSAISGVNVINSHVNFTIRNGTVRGWGGFGIALGAKGTADHCQVRGNGADGINGFSSCKLIACTAVGQTGLTSAGIHVDSQGVLIDCVATDNTGDGIYAGGSSALNACVASSNGGGGFGSGFRLGDRNALRDCAANGNHLDGFDAGAVETLTNCLATFNFGNGFSFSGGGCSLSNCTAYGNSSNGFAVADTSSLQNCTASTNSIGILTTDGTSLLNCSAGHNSGSAGIQVGNECTLNNCTATSNSGDGIHVADRCQITGSTSNSNGSGANGSGITAGLRALVKNCNASNNQKSGIVVLGASFVLENEVSQNGVGGAAAGIDSSGGSASRIEANQARNNTGTGILGAGNDVIIRNTSFTNTTNYNPATGTNVGPIQTANTSPPNPWANF